MLNNPDPPDIDSDMLLLLIPFHLLVKSLDTPKSLIAYPFDNNVHSVP